MAAALLEWLAVNLRWFHLVTGAAWIGASFYFNWLNNHVRPLDGKDPDPAVKGEVFAIHGGAFYRASKYDGAPARLPKVLHWFKWEAYFTWITGFLLLALVYWHDARAMMIDPHVRALSPGAAVGIGAATLVGGYLVYDLLCRSPLSARPRALAGVGFALFVALSAALFEVFAPRAAAMHLGAAIGTIMATNVAHVIIPGQRDMVEAMVAGRPPPLARGAAGALRSLHNNYLTLPALLLMVANHYPAVWSGPGGWWRVPLLCVLGVMIRHGFNLRGQGAPRPFVVSWLGAAGLAGLAAAPLLSAAPAPAAVSTPKATVTQVQMVLAARCLPCHSTEPTQAGVPVAPKGLVLEDRATIEANRDRIGAQVEARTMPLGNLTGMTEEERALVVAWAKGG
jgi:uncharacterized membrane protein